MSENASGADGAAKTPKVPATVIEPAGAVDAFEAAAAASVVDSTAAEGQAPSSKTKRGKRRDGASTSNAKSGSGSAASVSFQDATVGFFQGLGRTAWAYADAHPHATLYGLIGFVVAVLILVIGLWDTIVIAVFVAIGVAIGQMVDGDNAIVNFFSRLFSKHR